MNKLPLIVALGAASLCSFANAQSVQVYGRLYPFMVKESGSGATPAGTAVSSLSPSPTGTSGIGGTTGMVAGNSNLGFRGKEDLGDGLKAEFQLEGTLAVDSGASDGFRFNRNTFVGLAGKFGTVRLGNMDTVFKEYGDTLGMLGISSGTFLSSSDLLRKTGFGTSSASSFHLRRTNSLQWQSPEISGFQVGVQWSPGEAPSGSRNPTVKSIGVQYDSGPIYLALAHEIHDDMFGGSANAPSSQRNNGATDPTTSTDKATQFTIEWRPQKTMRFEFDVIRKNYKENATVTGRFQSYQNTAYLLAMDLRFGLWRIDAHLVKASAGSCSRVATACSTNGLNGTKMSLGAAYYLSKRTYLFGVVDQVRNGTSARYDNTEFQSPALGEDIRNIAMGVSHAF